MFDEPLDEPPPLKRGDKLFINNQWRQHLDIAESYQYLGYKRAGFMSYSTAYKLAADRLVQTLHINSSPDIYLDALVLPIVFLYRHYVELTLKDLVSDGNEKFGNPPIDFTKYGHRIDQWWNEL